MLNRKPVLILLAFVAFGCQTNSSSVTGEQGISSAKEDTFEHKLSEKEMAAVFEGYQKYISAAPIDNCSGDPTDLLNRMAKEAENMVLDQFPIPLDEEKKLGEKMHQEIGEEFTINDSHPRYKYVSKIFEKLLPFRERTEIEFNIHLVEHEMINAFAISGGHVYITTGLLDFVDSEDELAVVLGHEIGHIDRFHSVRKIQKLAIAGQFGDLGVMAANIQLILTAPFGQVDEYESDTRGADLSFKAGYNPRKGKDFFTKLKQNEQYNLLEKMLRSHPYSEQREKCLEAYIKDNFD